MERPTPALERAPGTGSNLEGPQRFKVQFTASEEYVALVEEAKALLAHALPRADIAEVHLRAMRTLVAELKKRRYATNARDANSSAIAESPDAAKPALDVTSKNAEPSPRAPESWTSSTDKHSDDPAESARFAIFVDFREVPLTWRNRANRRSVPGTRKRDETQVSSFRPQRRHPGHLNRTLSGAHHVCAPRWRCSLVTASPRRFSKPSRCSPPSDWAIWNGVSARDLQRPPLHVPGAALRKYIPILIRLRQPLERHRVTRDPRRRGVYA